MKCPIPRITIQNGRTHVSLSLNFTPVSSRIFGLGRSVSQRPRTNIHARIKLNSGSWACLLWNSEMQFAAENGAILGPYPTSVIITRGISFSLQTSAKKKLMSQTTPASSKLPQQFEEKVHQLKQATGLHISSVYKSVM